MEEGAEEKMIWSPDGNQAYFLFWIVTGRTVNGLETCMTVNGSF